ncbi:MAG: hypothetical protein HF978_16590 [Desulfobacteraceae bacterium]|nr:hypothetical protein [Desulfobacteraceae bacterium]MBC2757162.1 hypothetical protein [Desulfobacteraceae bacterium]
MEILSKPGPMFTDLYELTMTAAYVDHQVTGNAFFLYLSGIFHGIGIILSPPAWKMP